MTAKIVYSYPDRGFWNTYVTLWKNSMHPSVFQSPNLMKSLANRFRSSLAIYQACEGGELIGLAFFRKQGATYRFLTDVKADHNFFILRKNCTSEQVESFFEAFFREVKKERWTLVLNKKPVWAKYYKIFSKQADSSDMFCVNARYAVCPVIEKDTPEELYETLTHSKEISYQCRRIVKQQNAVFESFTDAAELDEWIDGFCEMHIARWENTPTPSKYTNLEVRQILKGCLKAWVEDGVLARFSIRIGDRRIAYNFGLIQGKSFIGHAQTYDAEYRTYSPGKLLIHQIAGWMKKQEMTVFDFGDGDDIYKYNFATREQELNRIFISSNWNLPFIIKAKLQKSVKDNPALLRLIREKIKPMMHRVKRFNFQIIVSMAAEFMLGELFQIFA